MGGNAQMGSSACGQHDASNEPTNGTDDAVDDAGMSDMMTGGKMHVMKSGPGFYEEKTNNIGPNGKMTLIQNDEIDKANELEENDVDEHDVEVFDPNMLLREFEQVVHDDATKNEKEEKDWIQEMDKQLVKQIINDFNEFNNVEEGPKLPETGL